MGTQNGFKTASWRQRVLWEAPRCLYCIFVISPGGLFGGLLGSFLGPFRGHVWSIWGSIWARLWAIAGALGGLLGLLRPFLWPLSAVLGAACKLFESSTHFWQEPQDLPILEGD